MNFEAGCSGKAPRAPDRRFGPEFRKGDLEACILIQFGVGVKVNTMSHTLKTFGCYQSRKSLLAYADAFGLNKSKDT